MKRHKKKTIAAASIIATLTTMLTFWGQIYPVICPLLPGQVKCVQIGEAAKSIGPVLDKMQLDSDGGMP